MTEVTKHFCETKNVTEVTKNVTEVALWPFMAKYRSDWTGIVLSRGHRSKFIWSCFFKTVFERDFFFFLSVTKQLLRQS